MDGLAALSAAAAVDGLEPQLSMRLRHYAVHLASDAVAIPGVAEGQVDELVHVLTTLVQEAIKWC